MGEGNLILQGLVGPPPWKGTEKSTGAFACANRLSRSLWQQFAAFRHASRVFEIEVTGDKSKVTVSGLRWDPASSEQIAVTQTAAMDKAEELFERVVVALVDEQGTRSPRLVEPPLEGVAGSDPYAIDSFPGASKVTDPVKLKKTCDPLPSTVEVTPAGVVADSVSARWAASVHGTAPALTCSLTFAEHDEVMLMPVTIVTGTMKCGSLTCGRRGREDAGVEA